MDDERLNGGEWVGRPSDAGPESDAPVERDAQPDDDLFGWVDLPVRGGSGEDRPQTAASRGAGPRPAAAGGAADPRAAVAERAGVPGSAGARRRPAPLAAARLERRRVARRRRNSAGAVLLAMLLGFFVCGLFSARVLQKQIEGEPLGTGRSVGLALLSPMVALSGALRTDKAAAAVQTAFGRGESPHHTLAEVKKEKPLFPRAVSGGHPLSLYIAGDSMAQVFGSSLVNLAGETGVMKGKLDYHVSSGLSRPDFFDWPQRVIDQLVTVKPDAAVVLFGANDGQDFISQGKDLHVGSASWQKAYAHRVDKVMTILTEGGRRVYWVGNPVMRDLGYRRRISMMDHIYQIEAQKHPGVIYVPTWSLFTDKKGSYSEYLRDPGGGLVLMRASDGIHLTRAGGDRMAKLVLDVIAKDWGMKPPP